MKYFIGVFVVWMWLFMPGTAVSGTLITCKNGSFVVGKTATEIPCTSDLAVFRKKAFAACGKGVAVIDTSTGRTRILPGTRGVHRLFVLPDRVVGMDSGKGLWWFKDGQANRGVFNGRSVEEITGGHMAVAPAMAQTRTRVFRTAIPGYEGRVWVEEAVQGKHAVSHLRDVVKALYGRGYDAKVWKKQYGVFTAFGDDPETSRYIRIAFMRQDANGLVYAVEVPWENPVYPKAGSMIGYMVVAEPHGKAPVVFTGTGFQSPGSAGSVALVDQVDARNLVAGGVCANGLVISGHYFGFDGHGARTVACVSGQDMVFRAMGNPDLHYFVDVANRVSHSKTRQWTVKCAGNRLDLTAGGMHAQAGRCSGRVVACGHLVMDVEDRDVEVTDLYTGSRFWLQSFGRPKAAGCKDRRMWVAWNSASGPVVAWYLAGLRFEGDLMGLKTGKDAVIPGTTQGTSGTVTLAKAFNPAMPMGFMTRTLKCAGNQWHTGLVMPMFPWGNPAAVLSADGLPPVDLYTVDRVGGVQRRPVSWSQFLKDMGSMKLSDSYSFKCSGHGIKVKQGWHGSMGNYGGISAVVMERTGKLVVAHFGFLDSENYLEVNGSVDLDARKWSLEVMEGQSGRGFKRKGRLILAHKLDNHRMLVKGVTCKYKVLSCDKHGRARLANIKQCQVQGNDVILSGQADGRVLCDSGKCVLVLSALPTQFDSLSGLVHVRSSE